MSMYEYIEELAISEKSILEKIQGGNSDVFKYKDCNGNLRSLKIYRGSTSRILQMYNREVVALKLLHKNKFLNVPQDLQVIDRPKAISYQWINGSTPESDEIALDSIFKMINDLFVLSKGGLQFDNAIDAAFSTLDIEAQIKDRVRNLDSSLITYVKQINDKLNQYSEKFPTAKMYQNRTLSLSDIGTHNMIRNSGDDFFIDFEFFGYDSCAKMFGDFILHPRNCFSSEMILSKILELSLVKSGLKKEVWISLPLLSLKWALITLGRVERISHTDTFLIAEQNELQLKCDSYLRYFDFALSRNSDQPIITFREFELGQFI